MKNNLNKKYYTLRELVPIVKLKYRQLLVRVKLVSKKYENNKQLIYKKSNKWYIHFSIIKKDFKRKRNPINYKLFTTINSEDNFDKQCWKFIVLDINRKLKKFDTKNRIKYVIEYKDGSYHLHFITNFDKLKQLRTLIKNNFITSDENGMNTLVMKVWKDKGLHEYFRKQYRPVLLK